MNNKSVYTSNTITFAANNNSHRYIPLVPVLVEDLLANAVEDEQRISYTPNTITFAANNNSHRYIPLVPVLVEDLLADAVEDEQQISLYFKYNNIRC